MKHLKTMNPGHNKNRFSMAVLAVCGAVAALVVGCGGGGGGDSSGTPQPSAVPYSVAMQTATPVGNYTDANKLEAFNYLNKERLHCGFGALRQSALLDKAAQNHANYLRAKRTAMPSYLDFHHEVTGDPLFTGYDSDARANAVGYERAGPTAEVYTGPSVGSGTVADPNLVTTGSSAIRVWLSIPYHAMAALMPFTEVGVGFVDAVATDNTTANERVLNFGAGMTAVRGQLPAMSGVRTYPCEGSTNVIPDFNGETPNPVTAPRDSNAQPTGSSIVVVGDDAKVLTLATAQVIEVATGRSLPIYALRTKANDPNAAYYWSTHYGYVMTDEPMLPNSSYKATITGTNNGVSFSTTFTFKTGLKEFDSMLTH